MGQGIIEALEMRRMLAADLSVSMTTTVPATLTAGAVVKSAKATVTVKNLGTAIAKKTAGSLPVSVVLHPSSGADINLGTKSIKVSAFAAGKPIVVTVPLKLKNAPSSSGSYSVVAKIVPPVGLGDTNSSNDQASKAITVSGGSVGGGTTTGALSSIGYGSKLTFKKTGGINHNGTGYETGTFKDENGKKGSFYLTTAGGNLHNGLLALKDGNGTPVALTPIYTNTGNPSVGNKTLTFGGSASGSKGYIQLAGNNIYYK